MCRRSSVIRVLLQVNLQQVVCWVTNQDKGSLLLLTNTDAKMRKPVAGVIFSKHTDLTSPYLYLFHHYASTPDLIYLYIIPDIVKRVSKNMQDASVPGDNCVEEFSYWTLWYGPSRSYLWESITTLGR